MTPAEELSYREELEAGVSPVRELEIREALEPKSEARLTPSLLEGTEMGANVDKKLNQRAVDIGKSLMDYSKGENTLSHLPTQIGGAVAGGVMDVLGEGVSAAADAVIPENMQEKGKQLFTDFVNTDVGKALAGAAIKGAEYYKSMKEAHPQEAKSLEGLVNMALVLTPAKTKANAAPASLVDDATKKIGDVASKQIAVNREKFVTGLVLPKRTQKVKLGEVPRTEEKGFLKRSTITPTKNEVEIAKEVSRIKAVRNKNSIQTNYNAISAENTKIAKQLESDVAKSRVMIPVAESTKAIDDAIDVVIAESPIIVGNLQTTASRVADKAKQIIAANDSSASGLLKARKEFDNWVRTLPRGDAKLSADAAMEAQSVSIKTVRNAMNDMLDTKVKSTAVKRELKRQRLLYDALENIAPKAADEANSALSRAWQNAVSVLPIRNKLIQEAAMVAGIGGLGAAAKFAPVITIGAGMAGAGYGGYKLIISPSAKILVGKVLKATEKALLTSTNPSMVKQLRADRAILLELLERAEVSEETLEEDQQ